MSRLLRALHLWLFCNTVKSLEVSRRAPDLDDVIVTTAEGKVRGFVQIRKETEIYTYLGVPYAEAPTGSLRFQPPKRRTPWSDVRDARQFGYACHQISTIYSSKGPVDEDCLVADIYTPARPDLQGATQGLPVIVFVHGGAFSVGSGSRFDGTTIATYGVVLVTFNFRLAAFGFMSTEDDVIPGNYGMLDIVQVLKWIQENIAVFGGDPTRVTLSGQSSGACAVSLQIMSPLTKDLFQAAIMESGSSLTPWTLFMSPSAKESARLLGAEVGCVKEESTAFLACMQAVDAQLLVDASFKLTPILGGEGTMLPRVENSSGFLPDVPLRLLLTNQFHHVHTLRGLSTQEEASLKLFPWSGATRDDFYQNLLDDLSQFGLGPENDLVDKFTDYYIGNSSDPMLILKKMVDASTDINFFGPILNEIKLSAEMAPEKKHYLYRFGHRPSFSADPEWVITSHTQEVPFVFDSKTLYNAPFSSEDEMMSDQIMTMWRDFAATNDPTASLAYTGLKWEPYTLSACNFLYLDLDPHMKNVSRPEVSMMYFEILQKIYNITEFNIAY